MNLILPPLPELIRRPPVLLALCRTVWAPMRLAGVAALPPCLADAHSPGVNQTSDQTNRSRKCFALVIKLRKPSNCYLPCEWLLWLLRLVVARVILLNQEWNMWLRYQS